VAFGAALGRAGIVNAMMDLSDGLRRDLDRLCSASGCGALIHPERLPLDASLAGLSERLRLQVAFGEDYQLLLSAPPTSDGALIDLAKTHHIRLTNIGTLTSSSEVTLSEGCWPKADFAHFDPLPSS
jgi:thiamine-monophosphate kinase